ncbi:MAG: DUF1513 domain-containing protein [Rhodospirillales bacterium]|nr:DUF1513 domain-containing protein [Rhodospirillales bacterium]
MAMNRRTFNASMIALGLGMALPGGVRAAGAKSGFLSTGYDELHVRHLVSRIGPNLDIVWDLALPARGHGTAVRPGTDEGLVVARRPGEYAISFGLTDGEERHHITPAPGRHFYGHAVYSRDGNTLWMTENAYESGVGVIGVYDVAMGYKRIAEYSSGGIGPHQQLLMADGKTLAVANGGIRTHPDKGREKLNIGTMRPSLAYIDAMSGRIADQVYFEDLRQQKLSIRHMAALPDGRVAIGCQDQEDDGRTLPLVYIHDRTNNQGLQPMEVPDGILQRFNGYCGSVACDARGQMLAVSSPRGGLVGFWALPAGKWEGHIELADGCGLAPGPEGGMLASSGSGRVGRWAETLAPTETSEHAFRRWDNHMTSILA